MIECKISHGDIDPSIKDAYYIRDLVFTQEQGFPAEIDIDEYDKIAWQCILYKDATPVGTARLIPQENVGKIGRVAILKQHRGEGLGLVIMEALIKEAIRLEYKSLNLSAQVYAIPFYEKLGFEVLGDVYLEDGEPHINMIKPLISKTATELY